MGPEFYKQWALRGGLTSAALALLGTGVMIAQRDSHGDVGTSIHVQDFSSGSLVPIPSDALQNEDACTAVAQRNPRDPMGVARDLLKDVAVAGQALESQSPADDPQTSDEGSVATVGYDSPVSSSTAAKPPAVDQGTTQTDSADSTPAFQLPPPTAETSSAPSADIRGSESFEPAQAAIGLSLSGKTTGKEPGAATLNLPTSAVMSNDTQAKASPPAPSFEVPNTTGLSGADPSLPSATARLGAPQFPTNPVASPTDAQAAGALEQDPPPAPPSTSMTARIEPAATADASNPLRTRLGSPEIPASPLAANSLTNDAGAPASVPSLSMTAPPPSSAVTSSAVGGFPTPPLEFPSPSGDAPRSATSVQQGRQPAGPASDTGFSEPPPFTVSGSARSIPEAQTDSTRGSSNAIGASDRPGDRLLEGQQAPQLTIHKQGPAEVRIGQLAEFTIVVQNVGTTPAIDVTVADRVPRGMRLIDAQPMPRHVDGELQWNLGDLDVGAQKSITLRLQAEQEGELGSVARVRFSAGSGVRVQATQAQLEIIQHAPPNVLTGQQLEIEIELANRGSGTAEQVVLHADLGEGLEHPTGRSLDNVIQQLRPGEQKKLMLRLRATRPGPATCKLQLESSTAAMAESSTSVEVIAPQLAVALDGPTKRYLERQATYQLTVVNTGTAPATNVDIVAYLARGMTFVSTEHKGQYDPSQHAVFWSLAELPPGAPGKVPLTVLPVESGDHTVKVQARGDLNALAQVEKVVSVESLAELSFQITDEADPIEEGSQTSYEIRVTNTGSREDTGIQLSVQLPRGLTLVDTDPESSLSGNGEVLFAPLPKLGPKEERIYRLKVKGMNVGQHLIRASLRSDTLEVPVSREESTRVYGDE